MNDINEKEQSELNSTIHEREKAFFEEEPWNTVIAFAGGISLAAFVIWLSRIGTAGMGG
ncbi:MAG: hypothetical protein JW971_03205 [Synergistales bacterium]|nr:hypothetical protein [Synergistales bacterium]